MNPSQPIIFKGQEIADLPKDLYIPENGLQVLLESFSGPLDLLLYLIKRQNIDVLEIPVALITQQYMTYITLMKELHIDLASEYLVMASLLAEIKSRSLLPVSADETGEEPDPRAELIRRLQDYERFKLLAEQLNTLPREGRDVFAALANFNPEEPMAPPTLELSSLLQAFQDMIKKHVPPPSHYIPKEQYSVAEKMVCILGCLQQETDTIPFHCLFNSEEGRMGLIVTFIALLELLRTAMITITQSAPYHPIYVQRYITYES